MSPVSSDQSVRPQAVLAPADLRGVSLLVADGVVEISSLVEQLHHTILRLSPPIGQPASGVTRGITGLVYRSIRGIASLAGSGAGLALERLAPTIPAGRVNRDQWVSILNGVMGDYLEAQANPLAIPMQFSLDGSPLDLLAGLQEQQAIGAGRRLLISLHGLCLNETHWQRPTPAPSLPVGLAESLAYTPVFLRYNSGRHISQNGAELAAKLQRLVEIWPEPVDEIVLLGHSMGGLLARSACHYAVRDALLWVNRLSSIVALGSPHHGAPLERLGLKVHGLLGVSPYSAPFTRLGRLRSAGITDLRFGNLCTEDWQGLDRFEAHPDARQPILTADHVRHYAVAATLDSQADSLRSRTLGDGLVPVDSALGHHQRPELQLPVSSERQLVVCRSGHVDLMHHPDVQSRLYDWL